MLIALFTGLIAGLIHVWSGPDHLSAIAPIAVRSQRNSWFAGLKWGIGHSCGVFIVGGLSLVLRELIPVELISGWGERLVGVMLIGIGIWGFRKVFTMKIHAHTHKHDNDVHTHFHLHKQKGKHENPAAHVHIHAALGIGILHGFAGSSHFLGILPALAFPTIIQSVFYVTAFGAGTIISMIIFASSIGILSNRFASKNNTAYKWLMSVSASAALCVGVFWLIF